MLCNSCHSRNFISYCLKQVGRGKEDTPELDKNPGISDPGGLTLDHFKPVVLNMFQKLLLILCCEIIVKGKEEGEMHAMQITLQDISFQGIQTGPFASL